MKTKTIKLSDILANEKLSLNPKDYIGKKMIDPPSGWMYGFPKEIPESVSDIKEVKEWLVKNGYPQAMIDTFEKNNSPLPYRIWYEEK